MGRSGTGKSTLLQIIGCLDVPDSGSYLLNNTRVSGVSENILAEIRSKMIGFVFQSFCLLDHLTVLQNVMVPMEYSGVPHAFRRDVAMEWIKRFSIEHRATHRPSQLSGGERQRVALSRAMVNQPLLLLADEPTGNLDSHVRDEVFDIFRSLNYELGVTIVIVTHDAEIGERCKRILHMKEGLVQG
jgi:putative ABC transport system ATP-binding protein